MIGAGQLSLGEWAPTFDASLGQYHTPVKLARRMATAVGDLCGLRVLEPSAGGGNIVRELLRAGAAEVIAVEIDPRWAALLRQEFAGKPVRVINEDFTALSPLGVDLAVANPPLDGGAGTRHVRSMLDWAPRVISIVRAADLSGQANYLSLWSRCAIARQAHLPHRPVFNGDGGKTDFTVVDVRRSYDGPQVIEHWTDKWGA